MAKPDECTTRMSIGQWLRCGMCWEIKVGVSLLVLSKLLMLWGAPDPETLRWRAGFAVFHAAVACLVWGLVRDLWLIATTKFERNRRPKA